MSAEPVHDARLALWPAPSEDVGHAQLVGQLHAVLDGLTTLDPAAVEALSDGEVRAVCASLGNVKARVDAVLMPLARALSERDTARSVGAASTGVLLANDFGGDSRAAARLVRAAKNLSNAPAVESALGAGDVPGEQAGIIAAALARLPRSVDPADRARLESWLIDQVPVLSVQDLARAATRAAQAFATRAEADAHEDEQLRSRERRARRACSFWMSDNRDGTWRGGFTVPDAEAEMLRVALEAISAPRRDHLDVVDSDAGLAVESGDADAAGGASDASEAKPESGLPQWLPNDRRHREGRAFAAICSLLPADRLPTAGGISAVVTVNVDYDALTGQLSPGTLPSGARISAGRARLIACTAGIIPQVLGGASLPLDLGQTQRLFTATQRRAIARRDRGCIFPGCQRPADWCETHHWRDPWRPSEPGAPHGATDIGNGCLLCALHHRVVHDNNVAIRERGGYLELLVPPQRIGGPGMIRGPGHYDGDLLTTTGHNITAPEGTGGDVSVGAERSGSVLRWQRNHRWRA